MNYHNITKDDMLNGEGIRCVLWLAGCTHACHNCHNPSTWDIHGGIPFDQIAYQEVCHELEKNYVSGITLSGGDPLHPMNMSEIGQLMENIHVQFPDKTIWLYTGFLFEDIVNLPFMPFIDVLVDGKYEESLRNIHLKWKGSSNQRVIDVKKSISQNEVVLWSE